MDGTACVYRAFYAFSDLSTADGRPSQAIYGTVSIVRRLLRQHPGADCMVVFDSPGKTFRHEIYADYKATRKPMPDTLRPQLAPTREILAAMGLPLLAINGIEADDIIGTLAARAGARKVIIVSSDKDLMQMVGGDVSMFDTVNERMVRADGVVARFGVRPEQIPDYLALAGDSSDNIPGVSGVGAKTAVALLGAFGSVDGIYQNLDAVAGIKGLRGAKGVAKKLEQDRDKAWLSLDLATIRRDLAEVDVPVESLRNAEPDKAALAVLYQDWEFRAWSGELGEASEGGASAPEADGAQTWLQLADIADVADWAQEAQGLDVAVEPVQAGDPLPGQRRLAGLGLAVEGRPAVYVGIADPSPGDADPSPGDADAGFDPALLSKILRPLFEAPAAGVVSYDVKRALASLATLGIAARPVGDPMLANCLLRSADSHSWESLASRYLPDGAPGVRPGDETPSEAGRTAMRARVDLDIHARMSAEVAAEPGLRELLETLELPLSAVLSDMERAGVLLDVDLLAAHGASLEQRIGALERQAWEEAGERFNLNSPQQLQRVLYEDLGLRSSKRTGAGQPSTAESALQQLVGLHPLPGIMLEYRGMSKLLSTYVRALPKQIDPRSGRVHTTYQQAVTSTGRLSSVHPNLQNIPIRSTEGRQVRSAFIAAPGHCLVSADYSQVELRVMAHVSGDAGLIQAFGEGADIHRATAAEMFGVDESAVNDEQRRSAKAINFGIIYGMSEFGLASRLGISVADASDYIARYFERHAGVQDYMQRMTVQIHERGYVETPRGRRMHMPGIRSSNHAHRRAAERAAINAPVQGGAADIIKQAMLDVAAWLAKSRTDARMIMQVHDELVLECAEGVAEEVADALRRLMASAAELSVPLTVDVGQGKNWGAAH